MKVLFVATVVKTHIMTFHIPYLQWFKEQGWEVHVCARNDYPASDNWNGQIPSCDRFIDLPFARSPFSRKNFSVYRHLKHLIDQEHYDLIHCHTPVGGVLTRLAAQKARHHGTRVLYTAHGFHFFAGAPWQNWLLYYPVELWLAHLTDVLITINQEDFTRAKKMKARRVEYVPGVGVDLERFNPQLKTQKSHLRNQNDYRDSDFILIYVGELTRRKHQDLAIRAFSLLRVDFPNLRLLLPGSGELAQGYYQLAESLKVQDRIDFPGFRQDIPEWLAMSDLAISTAWHEGLPVNVLEAMAMGLPLIVTDCRGNRDLVKDQENGLVVAIDDIQALVLAIRKILVSREIREKYEFANLSLAKDYSIAKTLEKMRSIYQQNFEGDLCEKAQ